MDAGALSPESCETVTEGADQVWLEDGIVADRDALAVVETNAARDIAGKLRHASGMVVLQIAAPEERVFASRVHNVIDPADVGVLFAALRDAEAVA